MKRTPLKRKTPLVRKTPLHGATKLQTKTPLSSRRSTARRKGPATCHVRGCHTAHTPIRVTDDERYCEKHGTKVADVECRRFVRERDPKCVACGRSDEGVQWAHLITRGARYIRWDARNGCGLCARCHFAYTRRPAAWLVFCEKTWPTRIETLLRIEISGERSGDSVNTAEVIRTYRENAPWYAPWDAVA